MVSRIILCTTLALLNIAGCATRRSDQVAKAPATASQYMVEFRISEVASDGTARVITAPTVMVAGGKEAKVELKGGNGDPDAVLTARISPTVKAPSGKSLTSR